MYIDELLKNMFRSFFIITTGIVLSMYIFCLVFNPDAKFSVNEIGRILLMALAGDLPYFIFLSRKEPSKKQMMVRQVIHYLVLSVVLLFFASLWDWVALDNPVEVVIFLLLIFAVYAAVTIITRYRDKKLTDQINDRLKERYRL